MRELPPGSFSSSTPSPTPPARAAWGTYHTSEKGCSQAQAGRPVPEAPQAVLMSPYSQDEIRFPSEACPALPCVVWHLQTPAALCSAVTLTLGLPMK